LPGQEEAGTLRAMTEADSNCPRCGERLPAGFTRCDACGAHVVPPATAVREPHGPAGRAHAKAEGAGRHAPARASSSAMTGSGWMLLVVGLLCGGALGYTLRGAVGPREDGGMPQGPADVMSGMSGGGMGEGASAGPGAPGAMPPEVVKMMGEYRERLSKNPEDVEANIGMGNMFFDSHQWERAVEHYQRALDKTPGNPDVRVDMAIAYHQLGQNERAVEEMARVTRENPQHRNAWLNLGVVSAAMGDNARAVRSWEQYLTLEPNSPHAAALRAQIEDLKRGS
jgi:hypothetical protein